MNNDIKQDNSGGWFMTILQWREKHIQEKTFVLILALVVGVAGGFSALLLKEYKDVTSQLPVVLSKITMSFLFSVEALELLNDA